MKYLMKIALPLKDTDLRDSVRSIADSTWVNLSECILLLSMILYEGTDQEKRDVAKFLSLLPGACQAMQVAIDMGIGTRIGGIEY